MGRSSAHEQQTNRDVERAVALVSRVRGLTTSQSTDALRDRASHTGVSVHAAALAVLATRPTDELLTGPPARIPHPRDRDDRLRDH